MCENRDKICVVKIGGSQLRNAESYVTAARFIKQKFLESRWKPIVVVSAVKNTTDLLTMVLKGDAGSLDKFCGTYLEIARELASSRLMKRMLDEFECLKRVISSISYRDPLLRGWVLSYGERISKLLLVEALKQQNIDAYSLDALDLVVTSDVGEDATVEYCVTKKNLERVYNVILEKPAVPVIEGFIGRSRSGYVTTLGRGGSDYTATTIAALLSVKSVYLVTEVDGVMSADPRYVPHARIVSFMNYEEAIEASRFNVKGFNYKTFEPLKKFYKSTVYVGSWRRFGTKISESFECVREGPKVITYGYADRAFYIAVIGIGVQKLRFVVRVLNLLEAEGVELTGIEVSSERPSFIAKVGSSVTTGTLIRIHDRLVGDGAEV